MLVFTGGDRGKDPRPQTDIYDRLAGPPRFFNELGVRSIDVGAAAFDCMGAMPPHDHPHVYLNMGEQTEILCPYCSTEYRFNAALRWNETIPAGCWAASAKQNHSLSEQPMR
jgi:uncharacterized Zn-finger protein